MGKSANLLVELTLLFHLSHMAYIVDETYNCCIFLSKISFGHNNLRILMMYALLDQKIVCKIKALFPHLFANLFWGFGVRLPPF